MSKAIHYRWARNGMMVIAKDCEFLSCPVFVGEPDYAALEQERDRLRDLVAWYKTLMEYDGRTLDDPRSLSAQEIIANIRKLESALGGEGVKG